MPKPNWGTAGSGAITGAAAGSAFGPVGTAIGGGLGGLLGLFSGSAGAKKPTNTALSTLTKEQQELISLINEGLTSGEGPFGDLFGNFSEDRFQKGVVNPALKNFQENILPQIQEKFIAGNQVLGSGMRNAQIRASTDLQDKLAQLMYQAQQQHQQNKLTGINQVLGRPSLENVYKQGNPGPVESAFAGALPSSFEMLAKTIAG